MRVLIVDDDDIAREWLRELLAEHPAVAVVGEAATGPEAVEAMETLQPEVVLLDVGLPSMDGFEVLDCLVSGARPLVILTTAFDRHAVRAFEAHVLDYLVKPVERPRLAEALRRAAGELERRRATTATDRRGRTKSVRIAVRENERIVLVKPSEIDSVAAVGNYVRIQRGRDRFLIRQTMAAIEEQLRPYGFARIQRSVLVNLERVTELQREPGDTYSVVLNTGTRYRLSRHYRENLEAALGRF